MSLINKLFVIVSLATAMPQNQSNLLNIKPSNNVYKSLQDTTISLSSIFKLPENFTSSKVTPEELVLYTYFYNKTDFNNNFRNKFAETNTNYSCSDDTNELVTLDVLNGIMNGSFYNVIADLTIEREFDDYKDFTEAQGFGKIYNETVNLILRRVKRPDVMSCDGTCKQNNTNKLKKRRKYRRSGKPLWVQRRKNRRLLPAQRSFKKCSFVVDILYNETFACYGSIISSVMVISSASCLQRVFLLNESSPSIFLRVERTFINSSSINFPIIKTVFHPFYDPISLRNNLVLIVVDQNTFKDVNWLRKLKFKRKRDMKEDVGPIKVIGSSFSHNNETTNFTEHSLSSDIYYQSSLNECTNVYSSYYISKTNVCAKPESRSPSTGGDCRANLGSPAIVNSSLLGIVSFGEEYCEMKEKPLVLTRIAPYVPWITQHLNEIKTHLSNVIDNETSIYSKSLRKFMTRRSPNIRKWFHIGEPSNTEQPQFYSEVVKHKNNNVPSLQLRTTKIISARVRSRISTIPILKKKIHDGRKNVKITSDSYEEMNSRQHPYNPNFRQIDRNSDERADISEHENSMRYRTVPHSSFERIPIKNDREQIREHFDSGPAQIMKKVASKSPNNYINDYRNFKQKANDPIPNYDYYEDDDLMDVVDAPPPIESAFIKGASQPAHISPFTKATRYIIQKSKVLEKKLEHSPKYTLPTTVKAKPTVVKDAYGNAFRVGDYEYDYDEESETNMQYPHLRENDNVVDVVPRGSVAPAIVKFVPRTTLTMKIETISTTEIYMEYALNEKDWDSTTKKWHRPTLSSGEILKIAESVFHKQHHSKKKRKRHGAKKSHKRSKKVPHKTHYYY